MELTNNRRRTSHRIVEARILLSRYLYDYAQCGTVDVAFLMRPRNPMNHTSILYYLREFHNLIDSRDESFLAVLDRFVQDMRSKQFQSPHNPTTS